MINDALNQQFPSLSNLSREEMIELLADEEYFEATFNTLPEVIAVNQTSQTKLQQTIAIAQRNEAMRPNLESLRQETDRLFNEATTLKVQWAHLEQAQSDEFKKFSSTAQLTRLRAATSNQAYLSESLVKSFMEGSLEEEKFSNDYKEARKVFHKRAAVLEKWEKGKVEWRG